jgi:histidine ammonia-lyase
LLASRATQAAIAALRKVVPTLVHDRALKPDVDATIELVSSGELVTAVEEEIGPLE